MLASEVLCALSRCKVEFKTIGYMGYLPFFKRCLLCPLQRVRPVTLEFEESDENGPIIFTKVYISNGNRPPIKKSWTG